MQQFTTVQYSTVHVQHTRTHTYTHTVVLQQKCDNTTLIIFISTTTTTTTTTTWALISLSIISYFVMLFTYISIIIHIIRHTLSIADCVYCRKSYRRWCHLAAGVKYQYTTKLFIARSLLWPGVRLSVRHTPVLCLNG